MRKTKTRTPPRRRSTPPAPSSIMSSIKVKAFFPATRWPISASARERAFTISAFAPHWRFPSRRENSEIKTGGEIIGVIYIDSSVKNYTYSPDQLRLLTAIGLQAGLAIQNASLYRQGVQAERLAAIGETTAALSHSIKNILQALRGGADVVEMGLRGTNLVQVTKGWRIVRSKPRKNL